MRKNGLDEDVYILAIESSCDETAAAVVKNGRQVLSNVISSQIALHTLYGVLVFSPFNSLDLSSPFSLLLFTIS